MLQELILLFNDNVYCLLLSFKLRSLDLVYLAFDQSFVEFCSCVVAGLDVEFFDALLVVD